MLHDPEGLYEITGVLSDIKEISVVLSPYIASYVLFLSVQAGFVDIIPMISPNSSLQVPIYSVPRRTNWCPSQRSQRVLTTMKWPDICTT